MKFLFRILSKKSRTVTDGIFYEKCQKIIGAKPQSLEVYQRAFTHRSANKLDAQGLPISYERLEFLGDAVLGAVVAAHLYATSPSGDEGYLTKMRSKIVSRSNLNQCGKEMGLITMVDSRVHKSQFSDNIYGNLLEALLGAIYLDQGFEFCAQFIHQNILDRIDDIEKLEQKIASYKGLFIEFCQKKKKSFRFETFEEEGYEISKHFGVRLHFNGKVIAKARATSKKKAEEKAAQRGYFVLQNQIEN